MFANKTRQKDRSHPSTTMKQAFSTAALASVLTAGTVSPLQSRTVQALPHSRPYRADRFVCRDAVTVCRNVSFGTLPWGSNDIVSVLTISHFPFSLASSCWLYHTLTMNSISTYVGPAKNTMVDHGAQAHIDHGSTRRSFEKPNLTL